MKKNQSHDNKRYNTTVESRDRYSKVLTGLFCTFLTGTLLANVLTPAQATSPTENRTLAQQPELTAEVVLDGSYMTDLETFITDQFFGRDHWVALKSTMERILMKQENNSVYFGSNDTLINKLDTPDPDTMTKNAGYITSLSEKVSVPVYMSMIPTSATVWSHRLPKYAPTADEATIISDFYGDLGSKVTTIPMLDTLLAHKEEDIYYRTDHHWTSLGAYYGYVTLMESMGITPLPLSTYTETIVSDSFFGTTYSSSGVRWVSPDSISIYVPEDGVTVTSNFTGMPEDGSLYVPRYLDEKDKYSYFLGGVQPLCIIETQHTDAPSLLLIRDSYSDCMVPFLTAHFSEIHLLDLRFYNAGVSSYVQSSGLDNVVVNYSLSNFVNDQHLFKLGM